MAPHIRLHNFIRKSGAAENKVESFITKVGSADIPHEKVIELVNELFNISKSESIPLDQVPEYIRKKLKEKQKIDEEIKQADALLQDKAFNQNIQVLWC